MITFYFHAQNIHEKKALKVYDTISDIQKAVTNILKRIPQKSIKKSFDANRNIAEEEMYFEIKFSLKNCILLF